MMYVLRVADKEVLQSFFKSEIKSRHIPVSAFFSLKYFFKIFLYSSTCSEVGSSFLGVAFGT